MWWTASPNGGHWLPSCSRVRDGLKVPVRYSGSRHPEVRRGRAGNLSRLAGARDVYLPGKAIAEAPAAMAREAPRGGPGGFSFA